METALDVLSRAATMVQDNSNDTRLATKELPTAKWRRQRRIRAHEYALPIGSNLDNENTSCPNLISGSPERRNCYNHAALHETDDLGVEAPPILTLPLSSRTEGNLSPCVLGVRPLCEFNNRFNSCGQPNAIPVNILSHDGLLFIPQHAHQQPFNQQHLLAHHQQIMDIPLDMTIQNSTKPRSSPPPPYREPLSGSSYASTLVRPSVITQAPSKRTDIIGKDYAATNYTVNQILISNRENENEKKASLCENVIDEHFRRSLGADYAALFGKQSSDNSTQPVRPIHYTGSPSPTLVSLSSLTSFQPTRLESKDFHVDKQVSLHSNLRLVDIHLPPPDYHDSLLPIHSLIATKPVAVLHTPVSLATSSYTKDENRNTQSPITPLQPISVQRSTYVNASPSSDCFAVSNSNYKPVVSTIDDSINNVKKCVSHLQRPVVTCHTSPQRRYESYSLGVSNGKKLTMSNVVYESTNDTVSTIVERAQPNLCASSSCTKSDVTASVDDHFAKALGDAWEKLQKRK